MNTESTPNSKIPAALPKPPIMVMLVDDQAIVGEAVRRMLADQEDIDLHYCSDPLSCMEQAAQILPTVILLDLVMPQIDGLEVARLFRSNDTTAHTPIVMLSTTEDAGAKSQAFAVGANDYLVKLPDKVELTARIRYHSGSYLNRLQRDEAYRALRESQQQLLDTNTALTTLNQAFLQARVEVEQANQSLKAEIAERKMAMSALREVVENLRTTKEEAERANRAKSEFLSRMSHELRTPLNAILGFGQLLEMDTLTPSQQESVAQILSGGRHLLDLINEVLDIARIEAGRLTLSPEPVRVSEVMHDVLMLIQPLADQEGIRMEREAVTGCDHYVLADRQRLKQVLLNLLSNAVKYNRSGGAVRFSCRVLQAPGDEAPQSEADSPEPTPSQNCERLRVAIHDTGPGITQEDISRLFTAFERLKATESTVEGTGLGLALSKRLTELMNGTIGVDSVPGEGSTFWVELPIIEGPVEQHRRNGSLASGDAPVVDSTINRCVLYIEDNLPNLKLIEHILEQHPNVELLSAIQGSIGLDLARQHTPDLILLDLHLPDMSGAEVLRHLKGDLRTRDIPVIVISADATGGQIERLRAAGATEYLTKPLDVRRFLLLLNEMLQN
jgi:signal transduction histidine kinase